MNEGIWQGGMLGLLGSCIMGNLAFGIDNGNGAGR